MNTHIITMMQQQEEDLFREWHKRLQMTEELYIEEFKQDEVLNKEIFRIIFQSVQEYDTDQNNELRQFYAKLLEQDWSLNYLTAALQLFRRAMLSMIVKEEPSKEKIVDLYQELDEWFDPVIVHLVKDCSQNWHTAFTQQQETMSELTAPMIPVLDKVCVMPLIGTIQDERAGAMKENMLNGIVKFNASYVIIDITGVPAVDESFSCHLMQAIQGAGLLGATCLIAGVRPEIAQTIVKLGIQLNILSFASLHQGIAYVTGRL